MSSKAVKVDKFYSHFENQFEKSTEDILQLILF